MFTIYDIETSGLQRDSEVYEFAAIRLTDNMEIAGTYHYFFGKKEWTILESHIHGIDKELLEPHISDFYKNLAAVYGLMYDANVVGKNNNLFDNVVLTNFINRNIKDIGKEDTKIRPFKLGGSIDVENYMAPHFRKYMASIGTPVSPQKRGTLEQYMSVCGFTDQAIRDFASSIGIDVNDKRFIAHGAMYDTVLTYAAFAWLVSIGTGFTLA